MSNSLLPSFIVSFAWLHRDRVRGNQGRSFRIKVELLVWFADKTTSHLKWFAGVNVEICRPDLHLFIIRHAQSQKVPPNSKALEDLRECQKGP
jgi:hypothetical protein